VRRRETRAERRRMAGYWKGSHTVYDIRYHLVWVTRCRCEVLRDEVAKRARELIRQGCMSREIKILTGHLGRDHVHLLISPPPALSPAAIARYLKGHSSRMLQQEFSHLRERFSGRSIWAPGYLCSTTGEPTPDQIDKYLEGHDYADAHGQFTIEGATVP
jgi:putative transposase